MPNETQAKKKIAIICGGPSAERGISLNSARSVYDNLNKEKYEVSIIYFNPHLEAFAINPSQIYSNTPLDFDYKLKDEKLSLTHEELKARLQTVDLAFPAIHGLFGEDGKLQQMLEDFGVKYAGSNPKACANTSDKHACQEILKEKGFFTIANYVIKQGDPLPQLPKGDYVIKPLHGGSSLGVCYFQTQEELQQVLPTVFSHEPEAIIEPRFQGTEFTIIVIQNAKGEAVALYPTEIEFMSQSSFFDYRKKYLASAETRYHTPARFNQDILTKIRREAEKAFQALEMKDFARLDGWLTSDGTIWFSDINAISGMEQNSFLFQEAALLGLNHKQLLDYIINKTIDAPTQAQENREEIPVIFGGNTAERQISVISGTNVWMKLRNSSKYKPVPLFLSYEKKIHHIPQFICLHHTVEEMEEKVKLFKTPGFIESLQQKQQEVFAQLGIHVENAEEKLFIPEELTLEEIPQKYKFLFLGLHGGDGENGTIQAKLEAMHIPYNGPGPTCSALCMDKFLTGQAIDQANIPNVRTCKKMVLSLDQSTETIWEQITKANLGNSIILKPRGDGCSAGVIRINTQDQLKRAIDYFKGNHTSIPEKAIHESHGRIDLPSEKLTELLVEEFIETDKVSLDNLSIQWQNINDLIEVTVGVIGPKNNLYVMNPSQTIASNEILSLEEKFMGGTGINLTPPPQPYISPEAIMNARTNMKKVAETLGIEGYSRIDTFMNRKTGELIIIEANTLPGLTPSTVFYHQALAEAQPKAPREVLESIIEIGKQRYNQ